MKCLIGAFGARTPVQGNAAGLTTPMRQGQTGFQRQAVQPDRRVRGGLSLPRPSWRPLRHRFEPSRAGNRLVMETNEGTEEAVATQGDEHHVVLSADTNGDGKPDVWMTDTTGDGKADLYQFDTTGDGKIDVTVVEGAEEPGTDRLIVEGDGGHPPQV